MHGVAKFFEPPPAEGHLGGVSKFLLVFWFWSFLEPWIFQKLDDRFKNRTLKNVGELIKISYWFGWQFYEWFPNLYTIAVFRGLCFSTRTWAMGSAHTFWMQMDSCEHGPLDLGDMGESETRLSMGGDGWISLDFPHMDHALQFNVGGRVSLSERCNSSEKHRPEIKWE